MHGLYLLQSILAPIVRVRLQAPSYIVGRSSDCDLVVKHASVSRKHAQLHIDGENVLVTDLGSRNGTFLEERRIASAPLLPEQPLRFGNVAFLLTVCAHGGEGTGEEETDMAPVEAPQATKPTETIRVGEPLSEGQRRVFDLLAIGYSEKRIASRLSLSPHTVHNHIRAIYRAFKVHSRSRLLALVLGNVGGADRGDD